MAENHVRRALTVFAGYGDMEALVATDGRRFTYTELAARIRNTAAALWSFGVRPGKTVGILVTNAAEAIFVELGAHLIAARTVILQPIAPQAVLRKVLGYAGAEMFVYDVKDLGEAGRDLAERAGLPVLCIGTGGLGPDLTDPPEVAELPFTEDDITVEPVSLFQTSGTTGTPKLLRHGERFFRTVPEVAEFYRPTDGGRMRHLVVSGMWHSGAQSSVLMTLLSGGCYLMQPTLDTGKFLATIERERVTSTHFAPSTLYQLLDDPRLAGTDLSSLRSVTIAAAPAATARLVDAHRWFGAALNVVYGMSEHPMIAVLPDAGNPDRPELLGSCGRPWGDTRIEIRDPAGRPLPTGEAGEIWVTGSFLTEGYVDPEVQAASFDGEWLRTGDVGRIDENGYLSIVDRVADMILSGLASIVVYCRPMEDALASHPDVREAAVIGVPDDVMGEAAHGYVVRNPGATVTGEELRKHVVDQLNALWSPREVEFIDSLPLNEYGKVDKRQLRDRYLTGRSS